MQHPPSSSERPGAGAPPAATGAFASLPTRHAVLGLLAFSLSINLFLLVPALYMMQVYDRVLSSRSESTLAVLSLGLQRHRISELLEKKELAEDPTVRAALETSIAQIDSAIRNARVLSVRKKEVLEAKSTGEQKTYEGFECDVYRISLAGGNGEGCYAPLEKFGVAARSMQAVLDAMAAIEEMSGVGSPFTAVEGAFPVHSRLGSEMLGVQASLKNFRVIEPGAGKELRGLPEGYAAQQLGAP